MLIRNPELRLTVAATIAAVLNDIVQSEVGRGMKETQITTAIRTEMRHVRMSVEVEGMGAAIRAHEVTAGPKTQEVLTGMDMYVSVEAFDEEWKSKGMLVQAKRRSQLYRLGLRDQCHKMLDLNHKSYVWVYSEQGIEVLRAQKVVESGGSIQSLQRQPFGDYMNDVLACDEGDEGIGLPNVRDKERALIERMEELHARAALAFEVRTAKLVK